MTEPEQWRPIAALADRYEVSDAGRVRPAPGVGRGLILKASLIKGYLAIGFRVGGRTQSLRVHRMVCETFHGPSPKPNHVVRHLNDDRFDNRAVNLAWGSVSDNARDAVRNGRNALANRNACIAGHPFVEGSYRETAKGRRCRVCHRDHERRYRQLSGVHGTTTTVGEL